MTVARRDKLERLSAAARKAAKVRKRMRSVRGDAAPAPGSQVNRTRSVAELLERMRQVSADMQRQDR